MSEAKHTLIQPLWLSSNHANEQVLSEVAPSVHLEEVEKEAEKRIKIQGMDSNMLVSQPIPAWSTTRSNDDMDRILLYPPLKLQVCN